MCVIADNYLVKSLIKHKFSNLALFFEIEHYVQCMHSNYNILTEIAGKENIQKIFNNCRYPLIGYDGLCCIMLLRQNLLAINLIIAASNEL